MIRLNASVQLRDSANHAELHDLLTRLCEMSLREKGVVDYNAYESIIYDDRHVVVATFATRADFDRHAHASASLREGVEAIATLTWEVFDF